MLLRELLSHDLAWLHDGPREPIYEERTWAELTEVFLENPGFRFMVMVRLKRLLWSRGHRVPSAVLRRLIFWIYGAEISNSAELGPGLQVPHPHGVIIGGAAKIGKYVHIGQFCTIGANQGKRDDEGRTFPDIGDEVRIMAGSVVAGPVKVGDGAIVGANSVVTKDVGAEEVVSGVPAETLSVQGKRVDTIRDRVSRLEEKLAELERQYGSDENEEDS